MNRGALDLLLAYNDDEPSEEETILEPTVSDKYTLQENVNKSKLPLPSKFAKLANTQNGDQDNQQNGRIRNFAHERGNWATFVYIPFSSNYGLEELIDSLKTHISTVDLSMVDDFHISLTKTVVLKYHWIESFITSISERIKRTKRFLLVFNSLKIYCNEERTRTFIGLEISAGYNSLLSLTNTLDSCLIDYNLNTFYKEASFHMSVLWCLGDKLTELMTYLPAMNEVYKQISDNTDPTCWYINVDSIQCKTGNKYFTFSPSV